MVKASAPVARRIAPPIAGQRRPRSGETDLGKPGRAAARPSCSLSEGTKKKLPGALVMLVDIAAVNDLGRPVATAGSVARSKPFRGDRRRGGYAT